MDSAAKGKKSKESTPEKKLKSSLKKREKKKKIKESDILLKNYKIYEQQ